jgi:hypothetical protein
LSRCITDIEELPGGSVGKEPVADVIRRSARGPARTLDVDYDKNLVVETRRGRKSAAYDETPSGTQRGDAINEPCVGVEGTAKNNVGRNSESVDLVLQALTLGRSQG